METDLMGRRVFVTGATGFIGRRLVAALVKVGAEVAVLTRSRAGLHGLPQSVRAKIAGLGDGRALSGALQGQEIVFNLAYDVRASAAENLSGFDALVAAAEGAGVKRIVHLSSIVVYDAWPGGDCDEAGSMDRPGGGGYRQAKIAMERRLMEGPLPAAILQPTIVYGPGSALWTDGFAHALITGGVVLPEPEGLCNGVFVDDVVRACLAAATLASLGRERFVISGPEPFAWSALLRGYGEILGRGEVRMVARADLERALGPKPEDGVEMPPPLAARISAVGRRLIGHRRFEAMVRTLKRRLGKGGLLYPDHHHLEEYSGRGICRIDHARTRLGYAPEYDLAKGLTASADYLRGL